MGSPDDAATQDTARDQVPGRGRAGPGPAGHVVRVARTAEELAEYARLWSAVHPDAPLSGDEVRRRAAERNDGRRYFLADLDGRPAGTGFAGRTSVPERVAILIAVAPDARGGGLGSALLDASLAHARSLGATSVVGSVGETWLPWAERRGFEVYDRVIDLVLDLSGAETAGAPPDGIRIEELADRHVAGAFAVYAEGVGDMPSQVAHGANFDAWRAETATAPLVLVAVDGDDVVGYAQLEPRTGEVLGHEMTAVARSHRRRGIAGALKRRQIAWAAERGYRRLITETHLANEATRRLNESLGYQAQPPVFEVRRALT